MIAKSSLAETEARLSARNRLLHVDRGRVRLRDLCIDDLPALLRPGDLLVVNDAATLPASLLAQAPTCLEVRLCGEQPGGTWRAVLFGAGDWRTPTERRPPPPALEPGARITFATDFAATVESVSTISPRLCELRFDLADGALWMALYRYGRPVQYAHEPAPLPLALVQTPYAARPWAAEMPSAGRPLRLTLLAALARRGVRIVSLTHAAGLSSTGDPALDAALPLPERYEIPAATAEAVREARTAGGRVIAVGTTVVRALEGCAGTHDGAVVAGAGATDLVITRHDQPWVVDGLLSGIHAPDSSHFALLGAFLPPPLDTIYIVHAKLAGYHEHEFGDSTLVL